jgi:hypothetical protein
MLGLAFLLISVQAVNWKLTTYSNSTTCSQKALYYSDAIVYQFNCHSLMCAQFPAPSTSSVITTCVDGMPSTSLPVQLVTYGDHKCTQASEVISYANGTCMDLQTSSSFVTCGNGQGIIKSWGARDCTDGLVQSVFPVGDCVPTARGRWVRLEQCGADRMAPAMHAEPFPGQ